MILFYANELTKMGNWSTRQHRRCRELFGCRHFGTGVRFQRRKLHVNQEVHLRGHGHNQKFDWRPQFPDGMRSQLWSRGK